MRKKYEDNPLDIELSSDQDEEMQKLAMATELAAIVAESGEDVEGEVIRARQKMCHLILNSSRTM